MATPSAPGGPAATRLTCSNSFRWHNSSFLPAVAIYNQSAMKGFRNNARQGRVRSRSKPRTLLPSMAGEDGERPPPAKPHNVLDRGRVQSASSCRAASLNEIMNAYGQDVTQRPTRKGLGSAGPSNRQPAMSPFAGTPNGEHAMATSSEAQIGRQAATPFWERLAVPRHVRPRCPSTVPGVGPLEKEGSSMQRQKSCPAPPRSHYLYGLPMRRPTIRTFAPILKRLERSSAKSACEGMPYAPGGIHIKLPAPKCP